MRVCIIDDNQTNLKLLECVVREVDCALQVDTFLDPRVALEYCAVSTPDLVLVDFMMPDIDGHQVLRELRSRPSTQDIPIVMITALGDRSIRQKALELGATDFLTKPIEPYEVKARLTNLLALRQSHVYLQDRNQWLADEVLLATRTIHEREEELIVRLSKAAEFRDPETGSHIVRMAHYSRIIAAGLGLNEEECGLIYRAAPMHDVGKLGIPDRILLKPGPLDPTEREIMQRHARIGHAILADSESALIRKGAEIALSHHERFDGSGYPNGLAGESIPLVGRVVAVADVFDALTSSRPYKEAWSVERARAYLEENRGTHFDPACLDVFLAAWDEVMRIHLRCADLKVFPTAAPDVATSP